jgi:hypothetical protein
LATWPELRAFISSKYVVSDDTGNSMTMLFETEPGRSQLVTVLDLTPTGMNHVCIMSRIGDLNQINDATLRKILSDVGFAGLIMLNDSIWLQHSLLMDDLNADEFQIPLALVTNRADYLEQNYVGGDTN